MHTSLELLHKVIRSYKTAGGTDLTDITNDVLDGYPSDVTDVIEEIIKDSSESKEKERLKTPEKYYSKSLFHLAGELTEEVPWGELIESMETDEDYEFRKDNKLWATHELALKPTIKLDRAPCPWQHLRQHSQLVMTNGMAPRPNPQRP